MIRSFRTTLKTLLILKAEAYFVLAGNAEQTQACRQSEETK